MARVGAAEGSGGAPKSINEIMGVDLDDQPGAAADQQQYNMIRFGKKDKYEKFYDRETKDYVFRIENLPEAFAKLEETENYSQEKKLIDKKLQEHKDQKTLALEKFIDPEFTKIDIEPGYFSELNSSFKSSSDDIRKNYVKKM